MEICDDVNLDMISNLPANVTDQILVCLPIIEAVRTSVLSTKWRYRWTTIPELVFRHEKSSLPIHWLLNKKKFIDFIDRVLLLHTGVIHKFELSNMKRTNNFPILDCWILFLSRKNIKEFVLKFSYTHDGICYQLPTCLFSAQQISTLELHWCVLKQPATFTGFSNLKSLCLFGTTFVDKGGFECLISKCPLLERLTCGMVFETLGHVNICSPNLKYLCLSGSFEDICFENTPLLSDVSICLTAGNITNEMLEEFLRTETSNVVKVLSSLPSLRKLEAKMHFLEFLSFSKIPEKLPFTCHHLNNLTLELNFAAVNAICVTLCLLNSSPNLRELAIRFYPFNKPAYDIENFWEERTLIDWNMSGLQIVKITNNQGYKSELEFIKLLLANSPMLEMLSFRFGNSSIQDREGLKFLKELLIFPRASPEAKIKFLEQPEE